MLSPFRDCRSLVSRSVTGTRPTSGHRTGRIRIAAAVAATSVGLLAGCSSGSSAASAARPTAYVANGANVAAPGTTVSVVNLSSASAQPPVTTGSLPAGLAVTPNGQDVLVANKGDDTLSEIDVNTGSVVHQVTVGLEPDAVAVAPNGTLALVANFGAGTVTPVSLPSFRVGRPVAVGRQPTAIAVSPGGTLALVTNFEDGTVSPIALATMVAGSPVAVGSEPDAVFIAGNGDTALVADFLTSAVTPIHLPSLIPGPAFDVGGNPTGIVGLRTSTEAWVSAGNQLVPVDLATDHIGSPVPVGTTAQAVALAGGGGTAWVAGGNGTLIRVDLRRGVVAGRVGLGGRPSAVVIAAGPSSSG